MAQAEARAPVVTLPRARDPFAPSLSDRLSWSLNRLTHGLPVYRRSLGGTHPHKLLAKLSDPLPGDPDQGKAIAHGTLAAAGATSPTDGDSLWAGLGARRPAHRAAVHGFSWLRHLDAMADRPLAVETAQRLASGWEQRYGQLLEEAWAPLTLARRQTAFLAAAPLLLAGTDLVYRSRMLSLMARQARHLARVRHQVDDGLALFETQTAVTLSELLLPLGRRREDKAVKALGRVVDKLLLSDGGCLSRRPGDVLVLIRHLALVRSAFEGLEGQPPDWLIAALDRLGPFVRALRTGSGRLARFNGGGGEAPDQIDRLLASLGSPAKPINDGRYSGLQRMSRHRLLVLFDAGPPPPESLSASAGAGTLSFLLFDGSHPIVVNMGCGTVRPVPADLAALARATAAHSTLVLQDTHSTEVHPDWLGAGVTQVQMVRQEDETGILVEGSHDGYRRRYRLDHHRRLFLSADEPNLIGADRVTPPGRRRAKSVALAIRFHLHPDIAVQAAQDARSCLLKLSNGQGWRFRLGEGRVDLEDSLYLDPEQGPRRSRQLVVRAEAGPIETEILWAFEKLKRS